MPRIKPFRALKPSPLLQNKVITCPLENYDDGKAKQMLSENPYSFLHLIEPALDNPYLRGSKQELIYKKIAENFDSFIDNKVLIKNEIPSIYIYQVKHNGLIQTGIWALTHINDYLNGNIKKHEVTVKLREELLAEYLQHTGLDANPVLITYNPVKNIDLLIEKYTSLTENINFTLKDNSEHRIWAVNDRNDLNTIIKTFKNIPTVYIADGHHRIASIAKMAIHKRSLFNQDENAKFNYFSTAYFNTKQVKIIEYNRLVKDLNGLSTAEFLTEIGKHFKIEQVDDIHKPSAMHEFKMYLNYKWYKLEAKKHTYKNDDPVSVLDVTILQEWLFKPILNIEDPRNCSRVKFEGGKTSVEDLQKQVDIGIYAAAFLLFPVSIQQLINVADADGVMPPKSTWVEPKFLVGLLTNCF